MSKKITFVEPLSSFNGYSYSKLPLMGTVYLGTILKKAGHSVSVFNEDVSRVYDEKEGWIEQKLLDSDIVGFSTMTSTAKRAYQIADSLRQKKPSIKIIMGGSHASFLPLEALEHADLVVTGEAETVIEEAIDSIDKDGRIINGKPIEDLDSLPFPDFSLLSGKLSRRRHAPISTSRGCPFNCKFCSVTKMFGRRVRERSPENIIEEIQMRIKQGFSKFFFYDDNFTAKKEKVKSFLSGVIKKGLKFEWMVQSRADVAKDDELLKLMSKANCKRVLIGFESADPKVLKSYNKRQSVSEMVKCIKKLHKNEIKVHGMFMLGSDEDSEETIEKTVKFCHENKVDTAQFALLFPIPGTELYEELESQGRIFTKNWSWFDGTHVVFYPKKIDLFKLQEKFLWAWKKFYSLGHSIRGYLFSRYTLARWKRYNKQFMQWLHQLSERVPKPF